MSNLNPAITFQLNLAPDLLSLLHPDRYQTNQDLAQSQATFQRALIDSWFPDLLNGSNVEHKDAYQFTAYGEKAHYILKTYAIGQNPLVTVVGWTYSDGTTVAAGTTMPVYNGQYQVGSVTVQAARAEVQP